MLFVFCCFVVAYCLTLPAPLRLSTACQQGLRFYYCNGTNIFAVDTRFGTHVRVVNCGASNASCFASLFCVGSPLRASCAGFQPLNIHANYGMVAACGNGNVCVLVDAYSGELIFAKAAAGHDLTNTIRIFKPPGLCVCVCIVCMCVYVLACNVCGLRVMKNSLFSFSWRLERVGLSRRLRRDRRRRRPKHDKDHKHKRQHQRQERSISSAKRRSTTSHAWRCRARDGAEFNVNVSRGRVAHSDCNRYRFERRRRQQ